MQKIIILGSLFTTLLLTNEKEVSRGNKNTLESLTWHEKTEKKDENTETNIYTLYNANNHDLLQIILYSIDNFFLKKKYKGEFHYFGKTKTVECPEEDKKSIIITINSNNNIRNIESIKIEEYNGHAFKIIENIKNVIEKEEKSIILLHLNGITKTTNEKNITHKKIEHKFDNLNDIYNNDFELVEKLDRCNKFEFHIVTSRVEDEEYRNEAEDECINDNKCNGYCEARDTLINISYQIVNGDKKEKKN